MNSGVKKWKSMDNGNIEHTPLVRWLMVVINVVFPEPLYEWLRLNIK